ncbi:hypothetical protein Q31b_37550 [Novipirellula aureliae]|uniref:Uncharacterized protein n=1 Tax=Novipirellula aureliae TaxID=2527966 RepID=A0A5C6DS17_9BACT|nr:hypothetical protein [Novipirellula aureliae]TWU38677.1 hypothetical protein Q31b_37550 [Novipirellula aureliae]
MKSFAKLISLFFGSQMLLSGIGMGLYCFLSPEAFGQTEQRHGVDLRLMVLTIGMIPQIGLGSLLVWLGMPSRSRFRAYRLTRKTIDQVIDL